MIQRSKKNVEDKAKYKRVDMEAYDDDDLSVDAFAILHYILGQVDSWDTQMWQVRRRFKLSRARYYAAIAQLQDEGFLHLKAKRVGNRNVGWIYEWNDKPSELRIADTLTGDHSDTENSQSENSHSRHSKRTREYSNKGVSNKNPSSSNKGTTTTEGFSKEMGTGVQKKISPFNLESILCQVPLEPFHIHYHEKHHESYPLVLTKGVPRMKDIEAVFAIKDEWRINEFIENLPLWRTVHDASDINQRVTNFGYDPYAMLVLAQGEMVKAIKAEKARKERARKDEENARKERRWAFAKPRMIALLIKDWKLDLWFDRNHQFTQFVQECVLYEGLPQRVVDGLVAERQSRLNGDD